MNPQSEQKFLADNKNSKQVCEICLENEDTKLIKFCDQHHHYCSTCILSYVKTHLKNSFKQISCPSDKCQHTLQLDSHVSQSLPESVKKQYQQMLLRIKQFKQKVKFCPVCNNKLQEINQQKNMMCTHCDKKLCRQCLSSAHQFRGKCEINVLFQLRIKFKQCPNCKFVVQKSQGCDHMVCLCGHQFCYNCGKNRFSYTNHICESRSGQNRKYSL